MTDAELLDRLLADLRAKEAAAAQQAQPAPAPAVGADGMPEGAVYDPQTGQMTDRDLLRNRFKGQMGAGGAAILGAGQGASFGASDELTGALNALIPGQGTMGERYAFGREASRAMLDQAREDNPVAAIGGEILGGAATAAGLGYGATRPGMTLGERALTGLRGGAAEGAVYGGLSGEGATDRVEGALTGAGIGAGVGMAAPYVFAGGRGAVNAVVDPIAGALNAGNNARANRLLSATMDRAGRGVDDVQRYLDDAARDGQGVVTVADALGDAGQRRLAGVARSPGGEWIKETLDQRQLGQSERVGSFLREAFDAPDTAAAREAAMRAARGQAADTAYEAARSGAGPVDVRGALAAIDDRIGGMQGSGVRGDGIDARLASLRDRLSAPNTAASRVAPGANAVELSDFDRVLGVKQDVQDAIGAAVRAGRNNEARELGKLARALDQALEAASQGYRSANDDFARASREIDAIGIGADMSRPSMRAADTTRTFAGMTPEQQAAARVGYVDPLLGKVENAAPGVNTARTLVSPKRQTEFSAMARDPFLLNRRLGRENTMFETRARAGYGSPTSEMMGEMGEISAGDVGNMAAAVRGNIPAIAQLLIGGKNALTGNNDATRQAIARALLSQDTSGVAAAMTQAQKDEATRQIIEALMRSGGRAATAN
jgi:hypothetical protein